MAESRVKIPRRALALLLAGLAGAAPAEIDVAARVTPVEITVGDPVRYEITVTHPAGARAELPAVRGNTGALEVTGYAVRTGKAADGRTIVTHALTLAAYAVGRDTLPPQRVEIRAGGDTAAVVLYTQPTYLTVKPTAPAGARDIADIEDKERLPRGWPWALPILAAFLALAVWSYRKWRRWRQRRSAMPAPAPAPRVATAAEAALARLRALEEAGLIGSANPEGARLFAFALSEILREYLAARFGIDALEATTSELLERTTPLPLLPEQHVWLGEISVELDTVKFAAGALTGRDAGRLLEGARGFVRATPPPPPEGANPSAREDASP